MIRQFVSPAIQLTGDSVSHNRRCCVFDNGVVATGFCFTWFLQADLREMMRGYACGKTHFARVIVGYVFRLTSDDKGVKLTRFVFK